MVADVEPNAVEPDTEQGVEIAAPVDEPGDPATDPAVTPATMVTQALDKAGPAAKSVPVKKDGAGRKKDTARAVAKAETAVDPVVAAKAPAKTRPVHKARPAATPVVAAVTPAVPAPKVPVAIVPAPAIKAKQPKPPLKTPVAAPPVARTATVTSKETRKMATPTTEITEKFQTVIKDASEKAKSAFEKSQASFGEIGEFTKGNVEAMVESSKILATGLQEMTKGYLSGSKSAFETLTAEFKELAAVKSPSDLLEKQSTLMRKHFDAAVAASSKNSEAMLKLASEAFQPISNRVSLAVEKVKHAA